MFCIRCGHENEVGARFCSRCGTPVLPVEGRDVVEVTSGVSEGVPPVVAEGAVGAAPDVESYAQGLRPVVPVWLREVVGSGWDRAWWGALRAVGVLFGVGLVLALVIRFAVGDGWVVVGAVLPLYKLAGLFGYMFVRVPIRLGGSLDLVAVRGGGSVSVVVSLVGGFVVMVWALVAAGRYAVSSSVGDVREAMVGGAKVGVPFAALLYVGSFLVGVTSDVVSFVPSHGAALGVGLLWGLVFGAVGGLRAVRRGDWVGLVAEAVPSRYRLWVDATGGALRGVANGLWVTGIVVLVLVGYLVVESGAAGDLADVGGPVGVVAVILAGLLFLPNVVVDGLLFAHGGTMAAGGTMLGLPQVGAGFNLLGFPTGGGSMVGFAPWYVFAGVLIPLVAVIVAGHTAAAHARVRTVEDARKVGLRVGVPYAVVLWALAAVARSTVDASGGGHLYSAGVRIDGQFAVGISLVGAFFLPLIWGSVGGMVGARYYLSRLAGPTGQLVPAGSHRIQTPPPSPVPGDGSDPTDGEKARKCGECGTPVPVGNRFCFTCGTEQPAV
ncbi:MAG TPA: zinc ribbon domain-containing protein [Actinobacteria bacterium]|nr:zinc ribbon domain-containing protein [Actinomycetota bacterium]